MSILVNRALRGISAAALISALSACAAGPDFHPPVVAAGSSYLPASEQGQSPADARRFAASGQLPEDWWTLLNNPPVDALVQSGFDHSPTLAAATATLAESQDDLRAGEGLFYPHVDAGLGASRQLVSPVKTGLPGAGSVFNLFTLSGAVSYTFDLFGANRRTVEALRASVDYQSANVRAARLALASNIVDAAIARAAYFAELEATRDLVKLEQQQVDIAAVHVTAGTDSEAAVLSLRAQLEADQASLPTLEQKYDQTNHLLARLTGLRPDQFAAPEFCLSELQPPGETPLTVPSELARRRPDIQAAEAALHVANANVGVATANLFPSITLSGGYGFAGTDTQTLFNDAGKSWQGAASASQPVFEGGTLTAQRNAAKDAYSVALANYHETVLTAFQQVADQLRALTHDRESLAAETKAMADAVEALDIVSASYRAGLVSYTDVLTADMQVRQARIAFIEANAAQTQDTVALFVALGGGMPAK